jgi:hypothetical protein
MGMLVSPKKHFMGKFRGPGKRNTFDDTGLFKKTQSKKQIPNSISQTSY